MKKKLTSQKGYTFVELLIALVIIVTVGMVMVSILVYALRGSSKSNAVNLVRQEGNYAISQISKSVSYAKEFNGVTADGSTNYVKDCVTNTSTTNYVTVTAFDGTVNTFSCQNSLSPLINLSNVTLSSCSLTCTQTSLFTPPTIGIKFTLTKKNTSSFVENQSSVPFETSVSLKNY